MDYFTKEADFESAVIALLQNYGWEQNVLKNYTEKELIRNWAGILFENNRDIDRLNNIPLTVLSMEKLYLSQGRILKISFISIKRSV